MHPFKMDIKINDGKSIFFIAVFLYLVIVIAM
jgi:hypothetical protein